tara:strand:+ start:2613 stop:3266 length:654 start_codon:yes stop_codon:yes gene_type:complete
MATKKVTQLATATSAADLDLVMIVDVADNAMSPEGTNKQITKANLLSGVGGGVTQILEGTNVTISPAGGTGVVTINGSAGLLTQVETVVNNTDVLRMKYNDIPVTLVAAQFGKIIVPVNFTIVATAFGLAEGSSDDLRFGWDAATSGTADYMNNIGDYMNGITGGVVTTTIAAPNNTRFTTSLPLSADNQPLQAWCSDVFNGGWYMTIYTTYYTITV